MHNIGNAPLRLADVDDIILNKRSITVSEQALRNIDQVYQNVLRFASDERPIYGLNTGFGALAEIRINTEDQGTLQRNIILSHAVGVGDHLDTITAKTMMLLRLNTLAQGYSGASPQLLKNLTSLFNNDCAPYVPKKGSVGASGDLAPLAHLGLLLLGIGEAFIGEKLRTAEDALRLAQLSPLKLGLRDGLALINGTQAMAAIAVKAIREASDLALLADLTAAASIDALGGHQTPFDHRIHLLKPHKGQVTSAQHIRHAIRERRVKDFIKNVRTQDPYSLRCVPQVHGATRDVITHVSSTVEREINSVTDNPLIFIKNDEIEVKSCGNFHGQHLALSLDYLAMAVHELASIAERRLELLLNPLYSSGLPAFLIDDSGLNSGYMMLHVTATSLINENKVLTHPACTDSIPTSANREDHVSMGMTSANKLITIIDNTATVLAIECLLSMQALDFRPKNIAGVGVKKFHQAFREHVPFRNKDGLYKDDLKNALAWLRLPKTKMKIIEIFSDN